MTKHDNLITVQGYEKIKEEIEYRETTLRDSLSETLNEMRGQGDLKENDGYSMAVEQNDQNEEEILRLKRLLKESKVVKSKSKNKITLGSTVTVAYGKNDERIYTIVGEHNADPLKGKISYKSPIGSSLMDKKVGEKVTLTTPKGKLNCHIKSIQ